MKEILGSMKERGLDILASTQVRVGLGMAAVVGAGMLGAGMLVQEPIESAGSGLEWVAVGAVNGIVEFRDVTDELLVPGAFNTGVAVEIGAIAAAIALSYSRPRQNNQG